MNNISRVKKTYMKFCKDMESLESFYHITKLSYFMTDNLLDDKKLLDDINENIQYSSSISYSPADIKIIYDKIQAEWVSLKCYSRRYDLNYNQVKIDAVSGKLGKTIIKNKTTYVIWPREKQFSDDVRELDINKKIYSLKTCSKKRSRLKMINPTTDDFLSMINREKFTKNTFKKDVLYRLNENCFLSCFVYFENFIREIINNLIDMDPETLFSNKDISKEQITYSDVYNLSNDFTDINELKRCISKRIIDKQSSSKQSINSLINVIRDYFLDGDPYDTWYVLDNKKEEVNYSDLLDFKEIRNIIVHNNGILKKDSLNRVGVLVDKNNRIIFENVLYEKVFLTVKSISYKIYKLIDDKYNKGNN